MGEVNETRRSSGYFAVVVTAVSGAGEVVTMDVGAADVVAVVCAAADVVVVGGIGSGHLPSRSPMLLISAFERGSPA
ncbi:hypothetical protein AB0L63_27990 [Nocardia sp. NPDC051990]|uniref:hypothetical protein n=1 Tax=Nocardia sp. NPDC051990 TaxID=3155285 RepID=UPI003418CE80